jgi:hypothetical protein
MDQIKINQTGVSHTFSFWAANTFYIVRPQESETNQSVKKIAKLNWERPKCGLTSCLMIFSLLVMGFRPPMTSKPSILMKFSNFGVLGGGGGVNCFHER